MRGFAGKCVYTVEVTAVSIASSDNPLERSKKWRFDVKTGWVWAVSPALQQEGACMPRSGSSLGGFTASADGLIDQR